MKRIHFHIITFMTEVYLVIAMTDFDSVAFCSAGRTIDVRI